MGCSYGREEGILYKKRGGGGAVSLVHQEHVGPFCALLTHIKTGISGNQCALAAEQNIFMEEEEHNERLDHPPPGEHFLEWE